MTPTVATLRTAVASLAVHGIAHDQATSMLFARCRPRFDAAPSSHHAHALLHRIANARTYGTVARRRRMPKQRYPMALEAAYATKIIDLIRTARGAYDRLVDELPRLLARVQEQRGDAFGFRIDKVDDFAALSAGALEQRTVAGFDVVIENPAGSTRTWVNSDGSKGTTLMRYAYGFIAGARGADGEPVDVYIGPDDAPAFVYVVHQRRRSDDFATYDEDKVMLGFASADAAQAAYLAQYTDPRFFGGMSTFAIDDFRAELASRAAAGDDGIIAHRADAGELEFAKRLVDDAGRKMRSQIKDANAEKLAIYFARETSQAQRRELSRQLTASLGVEVLPDEQHIPQMLEYFTHENATLIGSIPEDLHRDVAALTARAFTKRMNPDTFAKLLQERFDIAESRARFIARDQLGKLWGQLNAYRQRGLGITEFTWRTQRDDRVRPTHKKLEGKVIAFDNLPPFGLPGEDYGCRCTGDPVVDQLLDRAAEMAGHDRPVTLNGKLPARAR